MADVIGDNRSGSAPVKLPWNLLRCQEKDVMVISLHRPAVPREERLSVAQTEEVSMQKGENNLLSQDA